MGKQEETQGPNSYFSEQNHKNQEMATMWFKIGQKRSKRPGPPLMGNRVANCGTPHGDDMLV
ncbi:hypothetical protein GCM10011375_29350 [Hymenobacter qilianensis]|uniref:Uncharacterized protein n=1 Tax=Hymenobacter qilianensis TaxID=1385715 RepID=A0ACB5PUB8_9BACT|nr:hypothetical protein GCM10011375_29350 [Hymenobacter qilianensis]